mgnify:CR=1 FL=1
MFERLKQARGLARKARERHAMAGERGLMSEVPALPLAETNEVIAKAILDSDHAPFLVGRSGVTEARVMRAVFARLTGDYFVTGALQSIPAEMEQKAKFQSGIVGKRPHDYLVFATEYLSAALSVDLYAHSEYVSDGGGIAQHLYQSGIPVTRIGNLEPLLALREGCNPWPQALAGKRVLVVHPFQESVRTGYERRKTILGIRDILPEFGNLDVIAPPVTFLDTETEHSWRTHLFDLTSQIASKEFDVAIIGAGAYGLPAAAFVRDTGRVAIHLGGATQLLFGIRGKRWTQHKDIGPWIDSSWISPSEAERTPGHARFEGGNGYW